MAAALAAGESSAPAVVRRRWRVRCGARQSPAAGIAAGLGCRAAAWARLVGCRGGAAVRAANLADMTTSRPIDEYASTLQAHFDAVAGDDGELDLGELTQVLKTSEASKSPTETFRDDGFARLLFRMIDADGPASSRAMSTSTRWCGCASARPSSASLLFCLYDEDGSGYIDRVELTKIVARQVSASKLKLDTSQIAQSVDAIFADADDDHSGEIDVEEFLECARRNPELAASIGVKGLPAPPGDGASVACVALDNTSQAKQWRNLLREHGQQLLTALVIAGLVGGAGYWKWAEHLEPHHAELYALLGDSLPAAKASAQGLKVLFLLLLLPVIRVPLTRLRDSCKLKVWAFDDRIQLHKLLGLASFVLTAIHVLAHVVNYARWADPARHDAWALAFPEDFAQNVTQPTLSELWARPVSITGVAMLACFAVGAPFAVGWPRRKRWFMRLCPRAAAALNDFSNFWITPHRPRPLLRLPRPAPLAGVPWKPTLTNHGDAWLGDAAGAHLRHLPLPPAIRRGEADEVIHARILKQDPKAPVKEGDVLHLKMEKPKKWASRPGEYLFLQVPEVSRTSGTRSRSRRARRRSTLACTFASPATGRAISSSSSRREPQSAPPLRCGCRRRRRRRRW